MAAHMVRAPSCFTTETFCINRTSTTIEVAFVIVWRSGSDFSAQRVLRTRESATRGLCDAPKTMMCLAEKAEMRMRSSTSYGFPKQQSTRTRGHLFRQSGKATASSCGGEARCSPPCGLGVTEGAAPLSSQSHRSPPERSAGLRASGRSKASRRARRARRGSSPSSPARRCARLRRPSRALASIRPWSGAPAAQRQSGEKHLTPRRVSPHLLDNEAKDHETVDEAQDGQGRRHKHLHRVLVDLQPRL